MKFDIMKINLGIITMATFVLTEDFLHFTLCLLGYLVFMHLLPRLFKKFKYSFSYGEGCLCLQGLIVFLVKTFLSFINNEHDPTSDIGKFNIIANVGLLSLLVLCSVSYIPMFDFINGSKTFFLTGFVMVFGLSLPYLWLHLQSNPIQWVLNYIWQSQNVLTLFMLWTIYTVIAIIFVMKPRSENASTVIRKYFHAMVVFVYTSGVLIDVNFLYLSSIVGICVMILLEHIRSQNIEPVSSHLNNVFQVFQDQKDQGDLVLTNIYLLAGVSIPLWLSADLKQDNPLILLSGVLCTGIGDAVASIIGSKFGKYHILNTNKTIEGFLASIWAQTIFIKILELLNLIVISQKKIEILFIIASVSIVEVMTTQVDNIALPFLMYSLMRCFIF
jgi:dolichol kinase